MSKQTNPPKSINRLILRLLRSKAGLILPDKLYLKIRHQAELGQKLNLKNPKTYNEKLQWLKLYNRKPELTMMADKYAVRDFVARTIGPQYLVPLLGVWQSFAKIDFTSLPERFVLKCTHDCDGLIICRNKSCLDLAAAKKFLNSSLAKNYFYVAREWPYKQIQPRIIAEQYLDDRSIDQYEDDTSPVLNVYKFFCFNGQPRFLLHSVDKGDDCRYDYFDMDFQPLAMSAGIKKADYAVLEPQNFAKMKQVAALLAQDICHVRVDLFNIAGRIYFNEMTFFNWAGYQPFYPAKWDEILGSWLVLPAKVQSLRQVVK